MSYAIRVGMRSKAAFDALAFFIVLSLVFSACRPTPKPKAVVEKVSPQFKFEVMADSLMIPWNIEIGPDGYLWATEQLNKVIRVSLNDHSVNPIELEAFERDSFYIFGMAFHPDFADNGMLYLSIMYPEFGQEAAYTGYLDIIMAEYDSAKNKIAQVATIIDSLHTPNSGIPGGRMKITTDRKLLVISSCETDTIISQYIDDLAGKTLRFNLDGSIPEDNPIENSPLYTYGHRNPQGLFVMDDGSMYVSEHGPSTDDEFNKLVKGGNYGWPLHRGVTDTEAEKQMVDTTAIQEALFYWTPTIAPSSLLYYDNDLLPSLKGHFLVSTLKETDIRLLRIEGVSTVETHTILEGEFGRIRDMAVDENGVLYLSTANILPLTRYAYETLDKDTSLYYDVIVKVYAEK